MPISTAMTEAILRRLHHLARRIGARPEREAAMVPSRVELAGGGPPARSGRDRGEL